MNRLSWNEMRARAARFADDWQNAHYERGETQTFYNEFFQIFDVKRRKVATFEEPVKKLGNKQGFIDLFWKGKLLVEQKSAGRDLARAREQALDYFPGLKDSELPRYILLCDFQNFELHDLELDKAVSFPLGELPQNIEAFSFIVGIEERVFRDQDPVNIEAAYKMGVLHDALAAANYRGNDLERFLVRLVFCLFADDTGIFEPRDIFVDYLRQRTSEDGSDVGSRLAQLFEVLNEPEEERVGNLEEDLREFPYINGDLFAERLRIPSFDAKMRELLLDVCDFNWNAISPAIFGALFQSVMKGEERRAHGAHYTTEHNILKVIEPLFLDDLKREYSRLRELKSGRKTRLEAFQEKLAALTFFDPACGCGNFLVIAYRELRELETEVLKEIYGTQQRVTDIAALVKCNVDQFYGIELGEFAARIAEIALWMTDHIENNRTSLALGEAFARIPLVTAPHIHHADALETDWGSVLPATQCDYILGNPPFVGAKLQSAQQRAQVQRISRSGGSGGTLDYVAAWFVKACEYSRAGQRPLSDAHLAFPRIGFVATNSITQGEQVAQLWPILFGRGGLEIAFAHQTFAWGSDARGMAHVHVVVLGLTARAETPPQKRLFLYTHGESAPRESSVAALSPYLIDAVRLADPHLVVAEAARPQNGAPQLVIGSKPIDDGNFIFKEDEKAEFLRGEPDAAPYFRPFVGADELISGRRRFILALHDIAPATLRRLPRVLARVEAVRAFRAASKSAPTQKLAQTPTLYHVNVLPQRDFLIIPKTSSERRAYVPMSYAKPPVVPSDAVFVLLDADAFTFGVLTSRMHMAWMRVLAGRLKSDYRYSIGIVYNTFPWPAADVPARERIGKLSASVLEARLQFPTSTLADLYDETAMPPALRRAHTALDGAVEKLYRAAPFSSDAERVEYLLALYEQQVAPLQALARQPVRRRRK